MCVILLNAERYPYLVAHRCVLVLLSLFMLYKQHIEVSVVYTGIACYYVMLSISIGIGACIVLRMSR